MALPDDLSRREMLLKLGLLFSGFVSMMLDTTACLPFVAGGKMKALAVASKARNPLSEGSLAVICRQSDT